MSRMSERTWYSLTVVLAMVVGAAYVCGAATVGGGFGFPLDDGWIHQTYARNLAHTGRFVYGASLVSTGSTSPLWTGLVSLAYLVGISPFVWTYALGAAFWLLLAWTSVSLFRRLFPEQRAVAGWVGLACLLEWHLAWASFSGMETILFAFLSLLLIERYAARARPFVLGLIGGLLFITRPEGILLVALVFTAGWTRQLGLFGQPKPASGRAATAWLTDLATGLAVLLVPYVVYNVVVSGQPMPNTFYAKQTEYRVLLARPVWVRLWTVVRRPLVGAQALLLPGFVWQAVRMARFRPGANTVNGDEGPGLVTGLLPVAWWGISLLVYALFLPVDYQYGRYVMPTIPYPLIYGIAGTTSWLRPRAPQMAVRVVSRAVPLAVACLFVAFLVVGGQAYIGDVSIINGEMVSAACWLRANTPQDALVAAHDIGAIGYYSERSLLDLAGLVSPEVIPLMRDEQRLLLFAIEKGADYLVTFPSWYPELVQDDRLLVRYRSDCQVTRQRGRDNMAVYQILP